MELTETLSTLVRKANRKGTDYWEDSEGNVVAKRCTKCGEAKLLSEFTRRENGLGGAYPSCRVCNNLQMREYQKRNRQELAEKRREYYLRKRDKRLEYNRDYCQRNRDKVAEYQREYRLRNRDRLSEQKRDYYLRNRDKRVAYEREYRKLNRVKIQEVIRNYRARNPEKIREIRLRRKARLAGLPDDWTAEEQLEAHNHFGGCALTGSPDIQWDHVIPISWGHGGTTAGNMIPLRSDLNNSKHDRNIFEWFSDNKERFNLSQTKFDELIEYLAKVNDMTVEEYRDYVYRCHDNPIESAG